MCEYILNVHACARIEVFHVLSAYSPSTIVYRHTSSDRLHTLVKHKTMLNTSTFSESDPTSTLAQYSEY